MVALCSLPCFFPPLCVDFISAWLPLCQNDLLHSKLHVNTSQCTAEKESLLVSLSRMRKILYKKSQQTIPVCLIFSNRNTSCGGHLPYLWSFWLFGIRILCQDRFEMLSSASSRQETDFALLTQTRVFYSRAGDAGSTELASSPSPPRPSPVQ